VLQCVAVCCSVLQCVAVCCSVLQCVAVCCSVLQCAYCVRLIGAPLCRSASFWDRIASFLQKWPSAGRASFAFIAPYLRNICALFAPYLRNICALFAHYLRIICASFAQHLRIICALFAHYLCIICATFAHHFQRANSALFGFRSLSFALYLCRMRRKTWQNDHVYTMIVVMRIIL